MERHAEQRQLGEVTRGVGALDQALKAGKVAPNVCEKLKQMGDAIQSTNYAAAQKLNVDLTTSTWAENKTWLKGTKYLIAMARKKFR